MSPEQRELTRIRGQNPTTQVDSDKRTNHALKLTSLMYLKEALVHERYEICQEVIDSAYEFGASSFEVDYVLANYKK